MEIATTTTITITTSPSSPSTNTSTNTTNTTTSSTSTTPLTTTHIASAPLPPPVSHPASLPLAPKPTTRRLLVLPLPAPRCGCLASPNCGCLLLGLRKWLRVKREKRGKRRAASANIEMELAESDGELLESKGDVFGARGVQSERGRRVVRRAPPVDPYAPSGSGSGSRSGSGSGSGSEGVELSWVEREAERAEEKRVERCRARLERYGRRAEGVGLGWRVRRALRWEV